MKALTKMLLALSCVLLSCSTRQTPPDVELRILFDVTDKMAGFPSAEDILSQLNLKSAPYQQIVIRVSTINDKDINSLTTILLEGEDEWSSNITIRRAKIANLQMQLQRCFDRIHQSDTSGHSIIYRQIARQANDLASSPARRKLMVVFSNLYEHSELDFYNPATLQELQAKPASIRQRLEQMEPLSTLTGIDLWLAYNPANYRDNSHYMPIANLYKDMLRRHGASVVVAAKFQTQ